GGVDLHFVDDTHPDVRLAGRFSAVEARKLEWQFAVEAPAGGGEVQLWCPDVASIGGRWSVWVEDLSSGRSVDIGRGARYSFTMQADEGPRLMLLRLTHNAGVLTLAGMTAQQTSGGGAQIAFTLSAPATCAVRVMNIAGRTIRTIEIDRLRPQGVNEVIWNGRSDLGTRVPGGLYLITVEAAAEDGAKVTAMRSLSVHR
ncbi:MAG: hypothetical protein J7M38_03170, partial [Armatimonadetes bacterium]|nr:hypothetical protein [Armatimonadota bacterium]